MKTIITLALFIITSVSYASSKLECIGGFKGVSLKDDYPLQGSVYYNYDTAFLICSVRAKLQKEQGEAFSCFGQWESGDEIAKVDFIPTTNGYRAIFKTAKVYEHKLVSVKCAN